MSQADVPTDAFPVKTIITTSLILGVTFLYYLNKWYSQKSLNNFVANSKWTWNREIVLITGGSSGIGASIVRLLSKKEVKTIIWDIQEPIAPLPPQVYYYQVDLKSETAIAETADLVRKQHGQPSVLINNAVMTSNGLLIERPLSSFKEVFATNVFAWLAMLHEFVPHMVKTNHGHVVTVASGAAIVPRAGNGDYASTKAALQQLHDTLGIELALHLDACRVRTTIVLPAWVDTPLLNRFRDTGKFDQTTTSPDVLAAKIVNRLYSGNSGVIYEPWFLAVTSGLRGWPFWLQNAFRIGFSRRVRPFTEPVLEKLRKQGLTREWR